jgi:hypothetical protein
MASGRAASQPRGIRRSPRNYNVGPLACQEWPAHRAAVRRACVRRGVETDLIGKDRAEEPGADGPDRWPLLTLAAWGTVAAQVLSTLVSLVTSNRAYWLAALAVGGGLTVLRAIILVGVRERGVWALWCGFAMSVISLATIPILLRTHVSGDFGVIEVTPVAAVMGWLTVLVNALFLVGAVMVLMGQRRRG